VGPLTRKELSARVQSGDVSPDTLVWREGLDDWRPLRNVAELGDLLRLVAQRMSGNLLDEMGKRPSERPAPAPTAPAARPSASPGATAGAKVVPLAAARPHEHPLSSARPMMTDDEEEATRISSVDPGIAAALLKSFAPLKPAAPPAAAPAAPAAPSDEVRDSGEHTVIEGPARSPVAGLRPAARPMGSPSRPPPAPAPQRPERTTAPSGTAAPAAQPTPSVPPEAAALSAGFDGPTHETAHPAPPPPAPAPAAVSEPPPPAPAPPAPTPSVRPSARPGAFDDDLPEDLFAKPTQPTAPTAPFAPAMSPLMTPSLAPPTATPFVTNPAVLPNPGPIPSIAPIPGIPATARPADRRGLSAGIALLFGGGMLVAGVAAGIVISQRTPRPAPAPAPVVAPPAPAPTPEALVAPPTPPPAPPAVPAPETPPGNPVDPETTPGQPAVAGAEHPSRNTGPRPHRPNEHAAAQSPTLTPEQQRMLRELERQGGGPSGGPVGTTPLRTQPAESGANPTDDASRGRAALRNFANSRIANNCWQSLLRINPSVTPRAVVVTLSINAQGRVARTSVSNSPDPRFDQCINSRVATLPPLGGGSPMDAQATVNLSVGD